MTFYYHFKDIYDLIEWAFEEEASRILEGKRTTILGSKATCAFLKI